jgi:hypothetical protein
MQPLQSEQVAKAGAGWRRLHRAFLVRIARIDLNLTVIAADNGKIPRLSLPFFAVPCKRGRTHITELPERR